MCGTGVCVHFSNLRGDSHVASKTVLKSRATQYFHLECGSLSLHAHRIAPYLQKAANVNRPLEEHLICYSLVFVFA